MQPIFVPAPPKSSFNKNRAPSDLLIGQLRHFQHVEHKSDIAIDAATALDIHTEAGAARYILALTRAIRQQSAKPVGIAVVPPRKPLDTIGSPGVGDGLTIAAVGDGPGAASERPVTKKLTHGKKRVKKNKRKKS
ncbi:MAG TPA: hypothetical protein VGD64_07800 [Acidisarcina sp.]